MTRLRERWATGPNDVPGEGEAVARLARLAGMDSVEQHPGAGVRGSNLTLRRVRMVLTVTAADGRSLRAFFDPRTDYPIPETEDAPRDLLAAMRRAWRARSGGRPPGSGRVLTWEQLVEAARQSSHDRPTAETLADDLMKGQRTVERVAAAGPSGNGIGGGMDAVRKAAGRQ